MAAAGTKLASDWSVDEVSSFLDGLKLSDASAKAKASGLTGADLELMGTDEITKVLGCSKEGAKCIKTGLSRHLAAHPDMDADSDDDLYPGTPLTSEPSIPFDTTGAIPTQGTGFKKLQSIKVTGDHSLPVDTATLKSYVDALDTIKRVEATGAEVQLPGEEQKLKGMMDVVRCKQTEYDELDKSMAYAKTKLKTAQKAGKGGLMARVAHGTLSKPSEQAKSDLIDAAQAQFDEVDRKLKASGEVLEDAKAAAAEQQVVVDRLTGLVTDLTSARQTEANVTASIFKGAAGDAKENQLEAAVDGMTAKLDQARQTKANFSQVHEQLKSAYKKLEDADDKWDNAKHLGKWERLWKKISGTKGSVVGDLARTSHCQAALALAQSALMDLLEAKQRIPDLPKLAPAQLTALKEGGLKNAYVDPTLPEDQHRSNLKANIKEAAKVRKAIASAEKWLMKWTSTRVDPDLSALEAQYTSQKTQLDLYRREIMEKELKARGLV